MADKRIVTVDYLNSEGLNKDYINNTFANALKGSKSGSALLIDDVSPVTHEMGVKVRGKNLLPYPYFDSSKSSEGATITVNGDRSISFSGIPTSYVRFVLYKGNALVKSGTFTISVGNLTNVSTTLFIYDGSGATLKTYSFIKSVTVNADDYPTAATWNITMARAASNQQINGTAYPQIELGTTATDYTPYVPDLTAVKVTRCGKNLFDKDNANILNTYFTADGVLNTNSTTTKSVWIPCSPNMTYTVSKMASARFAVGFTNEEPMNGVTVNNVTFLPTATKITVTSGNSDKYIIVWFYHSSYDTSVTVEEILASMQIELGTTATEYEPYKIPTEYTPTADGTVNGVTSLYPNTTLMTDTEGIIIDCEYNRDINKAFAELQQAIISLGGNV